MRIPKKILLTALVLLPAFGTGSVIRAEIFTNPSPAAHHDGDEHFDMGGVFSRCDVSDGEQKDEAQQDMEKRAAEHCSGRHIAVQVSETRFEEAHACIHYAGGELALAEFICAARPNQSEE